MFSQVCVKNSVHRVGGCLRRLCFNRCLSVHRVGGRGVCPERSLGDSLSRGSMSDPPPPERLRAASAHPTGGTHPTGMHFCYEK